MTTTCKRLVFALVAAAVACSLPLATTVSVGGCATTQDAVTSERDRVRAAAAAARETQLRLAELKTKPLPPLTPQLIDRWLSEQKGASVSPAFVQLYAKRDKPTPLRLVGASVDHPAVAVLARRARRIDAEGVPADWMDVARIEAARGALSTARAALAGAITVSAALEARVAVRDLGADVELHTWRVAYQLGRTLGGPLWDKAYRATYEKELLAQPDMALQALEPDDPAYLTLIAGLVKYEALAAGDAAHVTIGKIRSPIRWLRLRGGQKNERVGRLRHRLEVEGFAVRPAEGKPRAKKKATRFDSALVSALAAFQRTHGLVGTGRIDRLTLAALKTPLSTHLAQIRQALAHIRANPARRSSYRIVVNVPAFELRLIDKGQLVARHRVVVGNNKRVTDRRTGRTSRRNRTPVLASIVDVMVLNPAWRVPRRIKEGELDVAAQRRPGLYDDYRFHYDRNGVEWAVQLPGPRNALGRVKFIFTGGNGVFLHDTPRKRDFGKSYRALSHGCVRVQGALTLAKTLLEHDKNRVRWSHARSILGGGRETAIRLKAGVPIYLEYVTAGATVDGQLRFYPDIYGREATMKRKKR